MFFRYKKPGRSCKTPETKIRKIKRERKSERVIVREASLVAIIIPRFVLNLIKIIVGYLEIKNQPIEAGHGTTARNDNLPNKFLPNVFSCYGSLT